MRDSPEAKDTSQNIVPSARRVCRDSSMPLADHGIYHGMRYQARALAPVPAESSSSCWLAGTTALREENEVHLHIGWVIRIEWTLEAIAKRC